MSAIMIPIENQKEATQPSREQEDPSTAAANTPAGTNEMIPSNTEITQNLIPPGNPEDIANKRPPTPDTATLPSPEPIKTAATHNANLPVTAVSTTVAAAPITINQNSYYTSTSELTTATVGEEKSKVTPPLKIEDLLAAARAISSSKKQESRTKKDTEKPKSEKQIKKTPQSRGKISFTTAHKKAAMDAIKDKENANAKPEITDWETYKKFHNISTATATKPLTERSDNNGTNKSGIKSLHKDAKKKKDTDACQQRATIRRLFYADSEASSDEDDPTSDPNKTRNPNKMFPNSNRKRSSPTPAESSSQKQSKLPSPVKRKESTNTIIPPKKTAARSKPSTTRIRISAPSKPPIYTPSPSQILAKTNQEIAKRAREAERALVLQTGSPSAVHSTTTPNLFSQVGLMTSSQRLQLMEQLKDITNNLK